MKSVTITSGRHPFEILMLVAAGLAGLAYMLGLGGRGTPEQLIPGSAVWIWYLTLTVGSGVALIGVYLAQGSVAGVFRSLFVERAGMLVLGLSCAVYELALTLFSTHTPGTLLIIGGFATACLFRCVQTSRDLRRMEAEIGGDDGAS